MYRAHACVHTHTPSSHSIRTFCHESSTSSRGRLCAFTRARAHNSPTTHTHTIVSLCLYSFQHQLAEALHCLHAHGVAHRDVKPENIVLDEEQQTLYLIDFECAIDCSEDGDSKLGSPGTLCACAAEREGGREA